ncbi:group 1 truncated hemoglobin [Mycobacterium sp. ITM-2016-00317]|uniref:group I truncated hemoglobin n=1 Tax=Mycobacterium sp. ITM-2016-00317 TaxID=2099694 RepID=UPI000D4DD51D|nr:group 1 truncated hemoglobin [Mycobacterium sp. ITM-2016-00317]WNG85273.1 group 1 truncated hemoglobin [Mycobacterium sp. ITM-2016-00317]
MSIFDQIGGRAAVTAAVDDFYRRVIADPELTPYFDGVDMRRLKGHQRSFIAAAIGGPEPYLGRSMQEVHGGLAIQPAHFDRVVGHLVETLTDLGVEGSIIGQIGDRLAPLKAEIVAPEAPARAG